MADEIEEVSEDTPKKKKKKKVVKKKGGFLGKLLCLILGFLLGIAAVIGSVVGVVYYVANSPIDDTVEKVEDMTGTEIYAALFGNESKPGILNPKYADQKIGDLLGDVGKAIGDLAGENGSLASLNEISPKVTDLVNSLVKTIGKYGITLDTNTLINTPLQGDNGLVPYITNTVKATPIGDLFQAFSDGKMSPLFCAICYGEEGVDYSMDSEGNVTMLGGAQKTTISDLTSEDLSKIFDRIPVAAVINIDPSDTVMCAIAYGSTNRFTTDGSGKVIMTQITYTTNGADLLDDKNEKVDCTRENLGDVEKLTFANGEVQYVKDGKAYEDEACSKAALYKKIKIGDLQKDSMSIIDNVLLKDALSINDDTHAILKSLAYDENDNPRTIGQLRTKGTDLINEIRLDDIMTPDINNGLITHLLYGKKDVHYSDANGDGKIDDEEMELTYYYAVSDPTVILDQFKNPLPNAHLNLEQSTLKIEGREGVIKAGQGTPTFGSVQYKQILVKFHPTSLGDLAGSDNVITNLTKTITVEEIFDEATLNSNKFLPFVKGETIESLPNAIMDLTVTQVYADEIFEADGETLKESWKYLLTDKDGNVDKTIKVTDMNKMIDNMKNNVHNSTLNELAANGMVQFSGSTLNADIRTEVSITGLPPIYVWVTDSNGVTKKASEAFAGKTKMGELTVEQILQYVDGIIKVFDELESI